MQTQKNRARHKTERNILQGKHEVYLAEKNLTIGCKILTLKQGLQISGWGG